MVRLHCPQFDIRKPSLRPRHSGRIGILELIPGASPGHWPRRVAALSRGRKPMPIAPDRVGRKPSSVPRTAYWPTIRLTWIFTQRGFFRGVCPPPARLRARALSPTPPQGGSPVYVILSILCVHVHSGKNFQIPGVSPGSRGARSRGSEGLAVGVSPWNPSPTQSRVGGDSNHPGCSISNEPRRAQRSLHPEVPRKRKPPA